MRFALIVVRLYEAEIETVVVKTTFDVVTGKVALVAPAGTVTLEGTPTGAVVPLLGRRT